MKLLAVLSFALALVATVIAAPVEDVVPVLATALPATADGDGDFYPFSISLIQDCINGAKKTTGTIHFDWISYSVDLQFDAKAMHFFDFPGGKQLKITWDERNSYVNFDWGSCGWGMGQQKPCGWCIKKQNWSNAPIDCATNNKASRSYRASCFFDLHGGKGNAQLLAARESVVKTPRDIQPNVTISETDLILPVTASDALYVILFQVKITEYCEASEGHPLMAKADFSMGKYSYTFYYHQNQIAVIKGPFAGGDLVIGPYDYYDHYMNIKLGTCDQTQSWKPSAQLNCAAGNQTPRTRTLQCKVPYNGKALEARDVLEPTRVVALDATATVTGVPKILVIPSPDGTAAVILPFHVQVTEYCENGSKKAKGQYKNGNLQLDFNLPPGLINNIDHRVPGYAPFSIGPYDYSNSRLRFAYDPSHCEWFDNETWKQCGECRAGLWSGGDLNCAAGGSRTKDMDCSFILGSKFTVNPRSTPDLPSILALDPTTTTPVNPALGDTSYAPGHCSFSLTLFNECIYSPAENWHTQLIALLPSIQDNDCRTVVTYPEGAGRIDAGAKRLLGMGDFRIAFDSNDGQVYFSYNGGWWATNTKDDGKAFGLCQWGSWSKGGLQCGADTAGVYRLSDMTCIFKC